MTKKESGKRHKKISPSQVEGLIHERDEVSPWRILRIMSEFVSGFDFLRSHQRTVTFFGSARVKKDNPWYAEAEDLSHRLSKLGFTVITGAGPGIMEAANKGAHDAGGISAGVAIKLEHEEEVNKYVTRVETFKYFFIRKIMLAFSSKMYIFFPGGVGTLDELFEIITLIQTKKMSAVPVILVDKTFWAPLLDWIDNTLNKQHHLISREDVDIYKLVDSTDEAYRHITALRKKRII